MDVLTVEVKTTELDIVKEMIEELEWLRFFYKEAGYHFIESPLSAYATIRDKYEQEPKQAREEDLDGMC